MKDYVLRIYRRDKNDSRRLIGMVEEVGVKGSKPFSNLDGLWSILNSSRTETVRSKKPNRPNKLNRP